MTFLRTAAVLVALVLVTFATTPAGASTPGRRSCPDKYLTKGEFHQVHQGMTEKQVRHRFTDGARGLLMDGGPDSGYKSVAYRAGCDGGLYALVNYDQDEEWWVVTFKEWNLTDF